MKKITGSQEDREELRQLLVAMRSDSPLPLSQESWSRLYKLSRRFKYDYEFELDLFVSGVKG